MCSYVNVVVEIGRISSSRRRRFIGSSWSSRVSSYIKSLGIVAAVAAVAKFVANRLSNLG